MQKLKQVFIQGCTLLFLSLFVYTAVSKLLDHQNFLQVLYHAPLLHPIAPITAVAVPAAELTAAALLFLPMTRTTGLFAALLLMVVFTLYLAFMLLSGETLPCACGGVISTLGWKAHLLVNMALTALAFMAWRLRFGSEEGLYDPEQAIYT